MFFPPPTFRHSLGIFLHRYVTSPNNPLVDVISNTEGLVGSGSITPQTDAALSPKLLEILQCSESTRKRGLSDLIPLTGDKKIATKSLPKKSVNTVGHQIQTRCPANRKTQRSTGTDQGRNGQRPPFPLTTPHRRNLDQVPKPMDSVQNPTDVPGISVQAADSIHSDGSSFTVVDGSVDRKPTEVNREAGKFNNTRKFKPQQPRLSDQALSGPGQDHPAFPVEDSGRDPGQQCRRGSVRNRERATWHTIMSCDFADLELYLRTQEGYWIHWDGEVGAQNPRLDRRHLPEVGGRIPRTKQTESPKCWTFLYKELVIPRGSEGGDVFVLWQGSWDCTSKSNPSPMAPKRSRSQLCPLYLFLRISHFFTDGVDGGNSRTGNKCHYACLDEKVSRVWSRGVRRMRAWAERLLFGQDVIDQKIQTS